MNLTVSHTFITVSDQDQALQFYRDVIGLKVVNDVSFDGLRWLSLTPPAQPGVEVVLQVPEQYPDISPADRDAMAALVAKGLLAGVIFATDDCDATFEQLRAAGAEVLQEPIDQPYGVRDCAFRDPAGNMLRFSQPRS
jgi:catechol 2,3-dioxygenase-like lactoylglutathione lyase family enzyme